MTTSRLLVRLEDFRLLPVFVVVLGIGSRLRFSYEDGVAVAFNTTGRDFEIAITAFSPTVTLATVVGPLIEVPVMLFFAWAALRLRPRLFVGQPAADAGPALEAAHAH